MINYEKYFLIFDILIFFLFKIVFFNFNIKLFKIIFQIIIKN